MPRNGVSASDLHIRKYGSNLWDGSNGVRMQGALLGMGIGMPTINKSRWSRALGSIVFLGGTLVAAANGADGSALRGTRTEDAISQNQRIRGGIKTAIIRDVITESRKTSFTETQARDDRTRVILTDMERLTSEGLASGASSERIEQISALTNDRLDLLETIILIERLNAQTVIQRATTIDLSRRAVRRENVDARDLNPIVAKNSLSASERMSLDQSGTIIVDGDRPETRISPHVNRVAMLVNFRTVDFETELSALGIVDERLFSGQYEFEERTVDDGKRVEVIARERGDDRVRFVVTLASEFKFAMTDLKVYESGKLIRVFSASDFRIVDEVFIPFRTKLSLNQPAPDYYVAERIVEEVRINPRIPDAVFAAPPGFEIRDFSKVAARD